MPEPYPAKNGRYGEADFETVAVETKRHLSLVGLRAKSTSPVTCARVYLHGKSGCAATRADLVAPMSRSGFDVIAADYRGYGPNPGQPTEEGLHRDASAFLDLALTTSPHPVVLFGHSRGGVRIGAFTSMRAAHLPLPLFRTH